jgi:hypothetical protein
MYATLPNWGLLAGKEGRLREDGRAQVERSGAERRGEEIAAL